MQYEIVNSIVIEEDTVYVMSGSSDVRPLCFIRREDADYTAIFRKEGIHGLLTAICHQIYHGRYRLRAKSMITRAIRQGLHTLTLERFQAMEEDLAVKFLVELSEQVLQDSDDDSAEDVQKIN